MAIAKAYKTAVSAFLKSLATGIMAVNSIHSQVKISSIFAEQSRFSRHTISSLTGCMEFCLSFLVTVKSFYMKL
jgi:hypothetical protein